MQKRLYLLCPTDCLEPVINNTFKHENYFYFSIGNSFIIEEKTIRHIKKTIKKHHIKEVFFVLSNNNHIVKDALDTQGFKIKRLDNLYSQIIKHKKYSEIYWRTDYKQFSLLSYYLNTKIKELEIQLIYLSKLPIKISGKIYDRDKNTFSNIYSCLVCLQRHHLN